MAVGKGPMTLSQHNLCNMGRPALGGALPPSQVTFREGTKRVAYSLT